MGDIYLADVTTLLPFDGVNGATTFVDYSPSPQTIVNFSPQNAYLTTAVKKYGTASLYCNGNQTLYIESPNTVWDWGTGNFTVEAWVRCTGTTSAVYLFFAHGAGAGVSNYLGWGIMGSTRATRAYLNKTHYTFGTIANDGLFHHMAVSKASGVVRFFIDGTLAYSVNHSIALSDTGRKHIGSGASGVNRLLGYIDDFRVTNGVARYTANFTPPDALPYTIGGISGVVYEVNESGVSVPVARPVYLYERESGVKFAETTSGEDGAYAFSIVDSSLECYVMAIDDTSPIQRSAIVDKVVPS